MNAVASRIRALLAKTVDKGCTEAEAMTAATKAKELMDKYQIDLSDTELEEEGFKCGTTEGAEKRKFNVQRWIASAIAEYCEVRCWLKRDLSRRRMRYVFFGLSSDVELAAGF